ncbi:MAG: hypothetical protein U0167_09895 [bacterium]
MAERAIVHNGGCLHVIPVVPPAHSTVVGDLRRRAWRESLRDVVAATVKCMVENAALERPPVHRLEVEPVGPTEVAKLSGVAPVRARPRKAPN